MEQKNMPIVDEKNETESELDERAASSFSQLFIFFPKTKEIRLWGFLANIAAAHGRLVDLLVLLSHF
jgi:hypothetical protein